MNLRLMGNRILIEDVPEETRMGFVIPEQYREHRVGFVVAVGNGARIKNGRRPIPVKVGDKVVMSDDFRMPITIEGKDYLMINDEKVLCVLDEPKP